MFFFSKSQGFTGGVTCFSDSVGIRIGRLANTLMMIMMMVMIMIIMMMMINTGILMIGHLENKILYSLYKKFRHAGEYKC